MGQAMQQSGLAEEMARLQQGLRSARPDLRWGGRQRMDGESRMGFSDATGALAELADLDQLDDLLGQDYPGASLDDIDEELIERALGRAAVDDVAQLRRIERELRDQGYLQRGSDGLRLTPRALRRLGSTALRRVFDVLESRGRGGHDVRDAGAAGEVTGASREWRFGDEQPLDVVRTVRNAVLRTAAGAASTLGLAAEDFEVVETERRSSAAVALLVDMSYSMELRGTWGEAKTTALALHALISTKFPQDAIEIIGFSDYARVMSHRRARRARLGPRAGHQPAARADARAPPPRQAPQLRAGDPGDHRRRADRPPRRATASPTSPGRRRARRSRPRWPRSSGAPGAARRSTSSCSTTTRGWCEFMHEVGRRNGGRLFLPKQGALGEYVVADYLRSRNGRRRAAG